MDNIKITTYQNAADDGVTFAASIRSIAIMEEHGRKAILQKIVQLVAERYVAENYPQLIAKIDQQAIANLVIAESGKKIAEEIRLTPPPPVVVKDTEIYQRGIFGGVTRVR